VRTVPDGSVRDMAVTDGMAMTEVKASGLLAGGVAAVVVEGTRENGTRG
jgi:hypothetical protein